MAGNSTIHTADLGGQEAPRSGGPPEFDLDQWRDFPDIITDSLWQLGARDRASSHAGDYWGNFVPQIPNQILRRFTRPGDWVLDLFSGMGTTLIECRRLGRNGIGVELNADIAEQSRERIALAESSSDTTAEVLVGDSTSLGDGRRHSVPPRVARPRRRRLRVA
ncbi:MAG: hypothetical protein EPO26_11290 [Chloroflexota bacterium]|nr:MAG: hypothetical protein EPO26_11290 [Chloroflexota bacterium]